MSMTVRKKIELILVRTILSLLFKYLQTSVAWDYLFSFMKDKVYIVEQVILTSGRNIYPKEITSILNTLRYLHPKIVSQRKTTGNEIIRSYVQSVTAILPPEILADLEAIFQNPGKQDLKDLASLINYYDSKYATHLNTDSNLMKELRAWLWMEEEEKLVFKYCDRSQRQHFLFDQLLSTQSKEGLLLSESVIDQLRNIFYRYRNGLFNEGGTVLSLVIDSNMVVSMYAEMERVLLTGIQSDKHFNAEIAKKLLSHALLIFVQDLYCYQLLAYHLLQTNPHELPYARGIDCKKKNIVPKNDYEYQIELIELFLNVIQPDEKELFRDSVSYWPEFLLSNTSEPEGAIKQEEEKKSVKVENDTTGVEIVANIRQYIQIRFQPDLLNQSKDISHNHSIKKLYYLCHTFFHGNDRALSIFPAFLLHSILYHDSTLFPNISSHNFERLIHHFNSCITNELEYFFILFILVIPTINPKDKISDLMKLSNHETFTQVRDSYQKLIKVLLNCEFELAAFVKNDGHSLQKVLYQTIPDKKYQRMKLLMNLIDICVLKLENHDSLEPSLPRKTLITDEEFAMFMDKIDWLLQNQQIIKALQTNHQGIRRD